VDGSSAGIAMFQCAVLQMTVVGTKRTFQTVSFMSAFGGKADMGFAAQNVCF